MSIARVRVVFFLLLLVIVPCFGLVQTLRAQVRDRPTGTYTNMLYIKEVGDVIGEELKIVLVQGGEYEGALQFSEGEPGGLLIVEIKLTGKKITFAVPDTDAHAGEFSGTIERGVIRGGFRFKRGGVKSVTLKKGKSYWD